MGGAILSGLLESGATSDGITVTNRTEAKAAGAAVRPRHLALERDRIRMPTGPPCAGRASCWSPSSPRWSPTCCASCADAFEPDALVVSVAAGVTIATMEQLVPNAGVPLDAEHARRSCGAG